MSSVLLQLEKRILDEPRKGGCFVLSIDDIRPAGTENIAPYPLQAGDRDTWSPFWRQRELFFKRLKQSESRGVIEVADWTPDLAGAALRYAQAYRELIDGLITSQAAPEELYAALSVDTLLINVMNYSKQAEEALVILPTHPLRAAWVASYTQLLRTWETALLEIPKRKREQHVDLHALRLLVPADVPDPHRRYGDIATILHTDNDQIGAGDIQPERLAFRVCILIRTHLSPHSLTRIVATFLPKRSENCCPPM